jgi:phosphoribosylamine--glycine ligase
MNVLVVGGGGRENAIAWALAKSEINLFAAMNNKNPGIIKLCKDKQNIQKIQETKIVDIANWAETKKIDLAVIGLEDPLGWGITDELKKHGIPAVGPTKAASQLEMSKEFARNLLERNKIKGRIDYEVFDNVNDAKNFIEASERDLVIKPIGLTGGKGVKILGEHLANKKEAIEYVKEVIRDRIGNYSKVLIEEKLCGEEFTLQCFVDGKHVVPMPAVQDHKRAFEGDIGHNTGGMGSYSQNDGLLPFLKKEEYEDGVSIIKHVVQSMRKEGMEYKGILYGQFMLTVEGLKVIEFNARFGDPEAMNVLPLLNSDLIDTCWDIVDGNLSSNKIEFAKKATVCKYVVPEGYGTDQVKTGEELTIDEEGINNSGAIPFTAKINDENDVIRTTPSRSIALVGISDEIETAEEIAENAIKYISGPVYARHDIGKKELILKRIKHINELRKGYFLSHKPTLTNKFESVKVGRNKPIRDTIELSA